MQSQNATASLHHTGISSIALWPTQNVRARLAPALLLRPAAVFLLPHASQPRQNPIQSKKIMSQNQRHFLENLSHRGPLHVYTLESKGRTGTHNNKRLVGKITIYPLTWNRQALQDCSDTKARRISYLALVVHSLIPGKP